MNLRELAPDLWRWTAAHPAAATDPEPGSPDDWPAEVGCVAYAFESGTLVLIDPLVPEDGWPVLDRLVQEHGPAVHVLTTLKYHRRSRPEVVARYGARSSRARPALPAGVSSVPIRRLEETMFWLERPRALVPGDRLLGDGAGGVRMCPASWIAPTPRAELRAALAPLRELPVELVLVSHGEPVLRNGSAAISAALEREL